MPPTQEEGKGGGGHAIRSLLDTDLYKLTMQAAVLDHYPTTHVTYKFSNRTPEKKFNHEAVNWLRQEIESLGSLRFSNDEISYLRANVPQLPDRYLKYLTSFKLTPSEQVRLRFEPASKLSSSPGGGAELQIEIAGLWVETILYEIPVLALVSEAFFKFVDTDWDLRDQQSRACSKATRLLQSGCSFSEFGTRRRRSFDTQELVMRGLLDAQTQQKKQGGHEIATGSFRGTSNVFFARKYDLPAIGTVAHEWMMGIAAVHEDYDAANTIALQQWRQTMTDKFVGVALTDTFGTDVFLRAFAAHDDLARVYAGVRQDSGDPVRFINRIANFYDALGIAKAGKTIVFSDSLDVQACRKYKAATDEAGLQSSFGVGTFFTNDFYALTPPHDKSTPLNIVIKLSSADGKPAIKISDNLGKNTGDQATVDKVKHDLGYVERNWEGGDEDKRWDQSLN
ncbi:Quinolinate phosphoribosyl transferase [Lipomyces japonicus]|uniref:Quinolinate phosphoribosyl transferase n=1 Tax=Lipomyces japonicus TaxID=56871 RepID=UPI0034CEF3FD